MELVPGQDIDRISNLRAAFSATHGALKIAIRLGSAEQWTNQLPIFPDFDVKGRLSIRAVDRVATSLHIGNYLLVLQLQLTATQLISCVIEAPATIRGTRCAGRVPIHPGI